MTEYSPGETNPELSKLPGAQPGEDSVRGLLANYEIGQKLKQLRLRKKIALADLGRQTGLSPSMLSQLENGRLIPTLPTLARIAMAFDIGLDHFFNGHGTKRIFSIVRANERLRFPDHAGSPVPGRFFEVLAFGGAGGSLSAYLADFSNSGGTPSRHHSHEGSEFIHVLIGSLTINYQSEDHILHAGDSAYFDASEPHSYTGETEGDARALVVTSLPRQ